MSQENFSKKQEQKVSKEINIEKQSAAQSALNWLKDNWRKSTILGVGAVMSAPGMAQEDINKKADQEFFVEQNEKMEVITDKDTDTVIKNGKTYIVKKEEFYGEKVTNKELESAATSFDKIREKYIKGEVRAYEPIIINSRFKKLREGEFLGSTREESIQYGDEIITMRLFKEGQGKELIKYLKKVYGAEANKVIEEWGVDENSYETLINLKRDQFVRGIVHGQDKEYSRWVYLAAGKGNTGIPFVGVVTEKDIFMEGLAGCSGNPIFERISVDCDDTKEHNKNIQNMKMWDSSNTR